MSCDEISVFIYGEKRRASSIFIRLSLIQQSNKNATMVWCYQQSMVFDDIIIANKKKETERERENLDLSLPILDDGSVSEVR